MGHIQKIKLKTGIAFRVYYREGGKQQTKYFPPGTPEKVAALWKSQKENDISRNKLFDVQPDLRPALTLAKFAEIYLDRRKNEIDVKRHSYTLKIAMQYFNPDKPIDKISHETINNFRDEFLQDRLKKLNNPDFSTEQKIRRGVNKEMSFFRTVITWAYKKDFISQNPFDKVDFLKTTKPNTNHLPREKELEFYNALPATDIRIIYQILKFTGLRRGECLELRERNLLLDEGYFWLEKTKNRESEYIPIHKELLKILTEINLLTGERDRKLFNYHRDYVSQSFRRALDKIGLQHIKSPAHMLRHTFAVRIMENDLSDRGERLAGEMLRHKTAGMTRRYAKIARENLKRKLDGIDF